MISFGLRIATAGHNCLHLLCQEYGIPIKKRSDYIVRVLSLAVTHRFLFSYHPNVSTATWFDSNSGYMTIIVQDRFFVCHQSIIVQWLWRSCITVSRQPHFINEVIFLSKFQRYSKRAQRALARCYVVIIQFVVFVHDAYPDLSWWQHWLWISIVVFGDGADISIREIKSS